MIKNIVGSLISGILLVLLGISCTWQIFVVAEKTLYLSIMGVEITPRIISVSGPLYEYSKRGRRYDEHYNTIIKYLNQDGELITPTVINSINISIVYAKKYPNLYMNSSYGKGFFDLIFQQYNFWEVLFFIVVASVGLYAGCFLLVQLFCKSILDNEANTN